MAKKKAKSNGVIDTDELIDQWQKIGKELKIRHRKDLTDKQIDFMKLALSKDTKIIFVKGPAGTSKTYLAVYAALQLLNQKKVTDVIYVRSVAESASKGLGFLPGEMHDKFEPFLMPLIDKLEELLPKDDISYLNEERRVTGTPINYLRGASFNDKIIIGEEAQNFDSKELTTLITRIGEGSRAIIIGDPTQSDINGRSGFIKVYNAFDNQESADLGIHCFEFDKDDIVRSGLLKYIIEVLESIK